MLKKIVVLAGIARTGIKVEAIEPTQTMTLAPILKERPVPRC
jgi:hypothetical protein